MKKFTITLIALVVLSNALFAQFSFDPSIPANYEPVTVVLPPSPLKYQVLFVGGVDQVKTTATYGNAAGTHPAKQWHDFIGITPDPNNPSEFWVSVNHEMQQKNDFIGDGGGMTAFKVRRDANTDTLVVINQTLNDGRTGKFFNVDFVNTVGETGMNCAGITGPDGRIWTAEEWGVANNAAAISFLRDTANFTINAPEFPTINGQTIKKFQNLNWMVEIDPKQAKAIRKQYNWGRQQFEGGAISNDNKTVYLGEDATPGFFTKFVADVAGDFTKGKMYVYAHTKSPKWVEIDNTNLSKMLSFSTNAIAAGATVFNRLEWVAVDRLSGKVYMTETGRDNLGNSSGWKNAIAAGAPAAQHHTERATAFGTTPVSANYVDYYGRVLEYDPITENVTVHIEGGPDFTTANVPAAQYPSKHLSNPDGLNFITIGGKSFMIINEDLNGTTYGRMPDSKPIICELWLLDMAIQNPTVNDLVRISASPAGAEVTGAITSPDNKSMLINVQHPATTNHPLPPGRHSPPNPTRSHDNPRPVPR
jgi:secreted PhoX family phosphatase